jgi:hypothetical protein
MTKPAITYDSELALSIFCCWVVPTIYEVMNTGSMLEMQYTNFVVKT